MQCILGYKAYNKGLVNQFNEQYEIGKEYSTKGDVKWKNSGFHFSKNLEDVFRYYDGFADVDICLVVGYGNITSNYDEYYDYETIVSDHLRIINVLSREEIIKYAQTLDTPRLCRFIAGFKLTEEEIDYFITYSNDDVKKYIYYYQYGDENVFRR